MADGGNERANRIAGNWKWRPRDLSFGVGVVSVKMAEGNQRTGIAAFSRGHDSIDELAC